MKKLTMTVAAISAAACVHAATAFVKDGKPAADVVVEQKAADKAIDRARTELTNWVFKISGAALPVVSDAKQSKAGVKIVLGTPKTSDLVAALAAKRAADFAKFKDNDGFLIAEEGGFLGFGGKTIYLASATSKGVMNAVYRFLERNTDLIFARPIFAEDGFGTIYGHHADLANAVTDLVDVPSFGHHRFWTNHSEEQTRHEDRLLCKFEPPVGGFGPHTLQPFRKDHPEVQALLPDGKRNTALDYNLCYSNPKTLELMCQEVEKKFLADKAKGINYEMWFSGIADSWAICVCDDCKKDITCPNGKVVKFTDENFRSTQYNLFLDKVQAWMKARHPDFPMVRSDAYLFNAIPPAYNTGRPVGPYCPYVKNHKKPVYDDKVNATWHKRAEDYRNAGLPFFSLYEYYLCWTTPQYPHATSEVAQMDYKYYLDMGMKGIYLDVNCDEKGEGKGPFEMSAIEFWTMAKVMWDVNVDVKECRREFCRRAYREASAPMIELHEKLAEVYNADPTGCFWNDDPVIATKHYVVEGGLTDFVKGCLRRANEQVVHPGSKELLRRFTKRMLELVDKAEKAPKRVMYTVKQKPAGTPDLDPNGKYWKEIEPVGPVSHVARANVPGTNTTVKVTHDLKNLYYLFEFRNAKRWKEKFNDFKAKGQVDSFPKDEAFQWDTPVEIYIDGRLASSGSYYMFSNMFNGHRCTCFGSAVGKEEECLPWQVKMEPTENGLRLLAIFPFDAVGIDISKGNKIGSTFVAANDESWNGSQWHSPASFQTLWLEMK